MPDARSKVCLIVEDEENITSLLREALTKEGLSVLHSATGEDGIATALMQHPDIILLDIMLPGMDGFGVLAKLRQDAWGKTVPVIILTNLSPNDRAIDIVTKNEPSYYLVKANTSTEDIVEKVKNTVK